MKKKTFFALALAAICVVGYLEAVYGMSELVIEKATGRTPEAKIESYIKAVSNGDKEQAFVAWSLPEMDATSVSSAEYYDNLKKQREAFTQDLMAKKISQNFQIKNVEWWSTCCEPHILDNSRSAGCAKFYVELTDSNNAKSACIFYLSVPGGYDGGLTSHYVRNWEIDSVSVAG